MKKYIVIISTIVMALALASVIFNTKTVNGQANSVLAQSQAPVLVDTYTINTVDIEVYRLEENGRQKTLNDGTIVKGHNYRLNYKPTNGVEGRLGEEFREKRADDVFDDYRLHPNKVTEVTSEPGIIAPKDMKGMFAGREDLVKMDFSGFDTSETTDMSQAFSYMRNLEELNLGDNFDTSKVLTFELTFDSLVKLKKLDLGDKFDTSSATNMRFMFYYLRSITELDLGDKFDTSKVKEFRAMFSGMPKLEKLDLKDKFDTSSAVNMSSMFSSNGAYEVNLGNKFDTSNVTTMYNMFGFYNLKELDLKDKFDTSKVKTMSAMFAGMPELRSLDLGDKFDTSNVKTMYEMFSGMDKIESLDLGPLFNTENLGNMGEMFAYSKELKKINFYDGIKFIKSNAWPYLPVRYKTPELVVPHGEGYTGKWIKEDGTAGPYTTDEMYDNPGDITGVWVWEKKDRIDIKVDVLFEGGYNKLPEEVKIKLYKDGEATDNVVTVKKSDINKDTGVVMVDFGKQYKYSDNDESQEIKYTVELVKETNHFEKVKNAHYRYVIPTGDIELPVDLPKEYTGKVIVELVRDGVPTGKKIVTTADDIRKDDGKVVFKDQELTEFDGKDYTFNENTITEIRGYDKEEDKDGNTTFIYHGAKEDINIKTNYIGGEALDRETIKVNMYKDGEFVKTIDITDVETFVGNLPTIGKDGKDIKYMFTIENDDELLDKHFKTSFKGEREINMEYMIPKGDKLFEIIYKNLGDSQAPTFKVVLIVDGKRTEKTITVKDGAISVTFKDLELTDKSGKEIKYTFDAVREIPSFNKEIKEEGTVLLLEKDLVNAEAIPHAGEAENFTVGLVLIATIVYASKMLKESRSARIARVLDRTTLRK